MAVFRKQGVNVYLCAATACLAIWQLLQYWQVAPEYYTLTFALAGLVLLIGYRLAGVGARPAGPAGVRVAPMP